MSGTSSAPGIVPRAISELFSVVEATAAEEKDVYFYVRLSLVELYNNNFRYGNFPSNISGSVFRNYFFYILCRNLLDFASKELAGKEFPETTGSSQQSRSPSSLHPSIGSRSDKIEIRESTTAGVFLSGSNLRIPVTTAQEAFQLISRGNKNRATGTTNCNDESSRFAHVPFILLFSGV